MRAVLICDEKLNKRIRGRLEAYRDDSLIIVTENRLYEEIRNSYPKVNLEFLDISSEKFFDEGEHISRRIVDNMGKEKDCQNSKNLSYISINTIYAVYARILVNVKNTMSVWITTFNINKIILFEGNRKVPFLGFNLAEGERPFRFWYKRAWFLNHIVDQLYAEKIEIDWRNQENSAFLYLSRKIRIDILNAGKLLKCCHKISRAKKNKPSQENQGIVLLVVRTKPVVEAMAPIYRRLKKSDGCKPLVLLYENYSNSNVAEELKKYGMDFVDLRGYTSLSDIGKAFSEIYCKKREGAKELSFYADKDVKITVERNILFRELGVQWWESLLLARALDNFKIRFGKKILCLINAETNNWVAATQALWAKRNSILAIGVQFVTLTPRPVTTWTDVYFLMSRKELELLSELRPKEHYLYSGPVCYDTIFDISKHRTGVLRKVVVFTQPDSFRSDAFRIVDDLIHIRKAMDQSWEICVKLHPREKNKKEFIQMYKNYDFITIVHNEKNSTELLEDADLAVSIVSTTLQQAVIAGVPALSVNYDNMCRYSLEVTKHGVVDTVTSSEELYNYLKDFHRLDQYSKEKRQDYLDHYMNGYHGNGAEIVVDYLEKRVSDCEIFG